jgi:hypothetical protein
VSVLVAVLRRDGAEQSASQAWRQALADADQLAVLHAAWTTETTPAREQRYLDLLAAALPPRHPLQPSHKAKWLCRTLRAAELAGLDARQVLADAVGERELTGARDVHAVLDARTRRRIATLALLPAPAWSAQVHATGDSARDAYLTELAALMDARKQRIGEHAAADSLPWAVAALGAVPGDPAARLDWQARAASVGAYCEMSGNDDPADPVGPDPGPGAPDLRAAWREAATVLGSAADPGVRGMPDGLLLRLRRTCPAGTACESPRPADKLRQARASGPPAPRPRPTRPVAAATTAKPPGTTPSRPATRPCTTSTGNARTPTPRLWKNTSPGKTPSAGNASWPSSQTPSSAAATPISPGPHSQPPSPSPGANPSPPRGPRNGWRPPARSRSSQPSTMSTPAVFPNGKAVISDHRHEPLRLAAGEWAAAARNAILQPPKPEIQPSARVLQRVADRDADREAGD